MATPYPPYFLVDPDAPPPGSGAPCAPPPETRCDACDTPIEGEPAGEGVYLWSRGGELVYEPAPLCEGCALAVSASANADAGDEEEEGG
ncbi:MAG TPA: hypothetical protein VFS43_28315 [Polyangiaceae bacterium]|nr:hypothetical protein [Polyangiaceae bacterium]